MYDISHSNPSPKGIPRAHLYAENTLQEETQWFFENWANCPLFWQLGPTVQGLTLWGRTKASIPCLDGMRIKSGSKFHVLEFWRWVEPYPEKGEEELVSLRANVAALRSLQLLK